jgi:hypothetical protein
MRPCPAAARESRHAGGDCLGQAQQQGNPQAEQHSDYGARCQNPDTCAVCRGYVQGEPDTAESDELGNNQ